MSPDPPVDPVEGCLSCSYDVGVALHSSDDSDEEADPQAGYDGYTLLGQQEPTGASQENIQDEEEENDVNENEVTYDSVNSEQVEPASSPAAGRAELIALWNTPATTSCIGITMDDERSAQIRAAMAGFSLPASSVPAWAANIPEEQWKQRLLDRLQQSGDINVHQNSVNIESKSSVVA